MQRCFHKVLGTAEQQDGMILIFFTFALLALGIMVGWAIDSSRGFLLKAELERTVDSAALAAASRISVSVAAAQSAACNAALMNGVGCGNLTVSQATVNDPSGVPVSGVRVTATATIPTSFMRMARLVGCGSRCDSITAAASAVAAPGGNLDLVMNLDDTGSMSSGGWIAPAKNGATALVNALVPSSANANWPTKLSLTPFRGCYANSNSGGCVDQREYSTGRIVSLSTSNVMLRNGIGALAGAGGSGTNNCEGLTQARLKLFQSGVSRANAVKYLVVLTDAESNYITNASFVSCRPASGPGTDNQKINRLVYNLAQDIKNGANVGTSGQLPNQTVKLLVIFYGTSTTVPANCIVPPTGQNYWNTTPVNLARCMASSAGDMYIAPTPASLQSVFQQIIGRLPVRIVN